MAEPMAETMRIVGAYQEAVQLIRALHNQRERGLDWRTKFSTPFIVCEECGVAWPCATERAIRKALGEDET
jgi:hypothetical protein